MIWLIGLLPLAVLLDGVGPVVSEPGLAELPAAIGLGGLGGLGIEGLLRRRACSCCSRTSTPRSREPGVSALEPKGGNSGAPSKGENSSRVPTGGKRNSVSMPAVVGVRMALEQSLAESAQGDGWGVFIGVVRPGEGKATKARARGARGTNERMVTT